MRANGDDRFRFIATVRVFQFGPKAGDVHVDSTRFQPLRIDTPDARQ